MCILNLRLGSLSRFIRRMSVLRSFGARVIFCIWAVASLVAAEWFGISKMPQRISDRLFNYSVHLSRWHAWIRCNRDF